MGSPTEIAMRAQTRASLGLRIREYQGPVDHPVMAELNNAVRAASGVVDRVRVSELDVDYAHPTNCDPSTDAFVAELNGTPVGYGRVWWVDRTTGERSFETI